MSDDIIIIGSGFAARQLVKNLRQRNSEQSIKLIAADSCDEYNKPELSHVFTRQQGAEDLTRQSAQDFAIQYSVQLHSHTHVTQLNPGDRLITTTAGQFTYGKLVLALGAEAARPPVEGGHLMTTLNSQQEYRLAQHDLQLSRHILLLGGGLIGCELAMDLARAGKKVTLVDRSGHLLSSLMPAEISLRLQHCLAAAGVEFCFNRELLSLSEAGARIEARLSDDRLLTCDAVICAVGLKPNTALAEAAGLATRRGIQVDSCHTTSDPFIFALGDCAERGGKLLPFLQPIQLAAMALAKTLTGERTPVSQPPMLVKIKTPDCPYQLAGDSASEELEWKMELGREGIIARGFSREGHLNAFVVSENQISQSFPLLKQLNN
ncbi:NADH:flavorubredoxin reductase NorW [Pantoea sp. BAV 3049]|uniref:NADH:flavorubredoxin reductase NorW n=1 Tax=Pantoea sp. BAV 3049 TaxID=2654188 RepID=UPI00131E4450|nr:NADH:flavorubredoxin reductase NorW [Pantoea sp. BAV 3049]